MQQQFSDRDIADRVQASLNHSFEGPVPPAGSPPFLGEKEQEKAKEDAESLTAGAGAQEPQDPARKALLAQRMATLDKPPTYLVKLQSLLDSFPTLLQSCTDTQGHVKLPSGAQLQGHMREHLGPAFHFSRSSMESVFRQALAQYAETSEFANQDVFSFAGNLREIALKYGTKATESTTNSELPTVQETNRAHWTR